MGIDPHGQMRGVGTKTERHSKSQDELGWQLGRTIPSLREQKHWKTLEQVFLQGEDLFDQQRVAQGRSDGICLLRPCLCRLESGLLGTGRERAAVSPERVGGK